MNAGLGMVRPIADQDKLISQCLGTGEAGNIVLNDVLSGFLGEMSEDSQLKLFAEIMIVVIPCT